MQNEELPYAHKEFKKRFLKTDEEISFFEFNDVIIKELEQKGKISTRNTYKSAFNRLKTFLGHSKLNFKDIDYQFLKKYEAHLSESGCSGGGVHFYMRTLRAIYNEAIKRGLVDEKFYPFSTQRNKNGYSFSHLKSNAKPRAMSDDELEKFKNFDFESHPALRDYYNYFMFSYYSRGMNFVDMANLKWPDLSAGRIQYIRSKTGKLMSIAMSDHLQKILDQYPRLEEHDYIFPIFSDFHKTPIQKKNRQTKCLRQFNKGLKEIAKIVGIESNITGYVSRHTFATTLVRKDVSVSKISQSMGHADVATTQVYLKKFEDKEIDELDKLL